MKKKWMGLGAIYLCSEILSSFILFFGNNQQNFAFFLLQIYAIIIHITKLNECTFKLGNISFLKKIPSVYLKTINLPPLLEIRLKFLVAFKPI